MKNFVFFTFLFVQLLLPELGFGQWTANPFDQKLFIENKGQFDNSCPEALFGSINSGVQIYLKKTGWVIRYDKPIYPEYENESEDKKESPEEERKKQSVKYETDVTELIWMGANPDVKIISEDPATNYFNYGDATKSNSAFSYCKAYQKIVCENIYPGIDIEYIFHQKQGIKYSFIVHPGADVSKIQLKYNSRKSPRLKSGNIYLPTIAGEIIDHAPITFYENDKSEITSSFLLNKSTVSFFIGEYDHTKTIIIDPWVTATVLPSTNKAYEVEKDPAGNVYVYGGTNPFVVNKYNSLGAIIWTLNLPLDPGITWSGDLLVDNNSFSYVTNAGSGPGNNIAKIDNITGLSVWAVYSGNGEYFRLTHNCDNSKVYSAGGPALAYMHEINAATGASTTTLFMAGNAEIKSITKAPNGNYYFLTNSNNRLYSANSLFSVLWSIPSTHNYTYYTPNYLIQNGGSNYIAVNNQFIYTYDGTLLLKRNICNGALLASTNVPGGIFELNGGLLLDSCGSVYAGGQNGIYKYDANLNLLTSYPTSAAVYDINIGINSGEILACGNGFVSSVNVGMCQKIPFPTICNPTLTATITTTSPSCSAGCTGTATATPSGTPPYTYLWMPGGQTTQTATGLCPGTYSVTITDRYTVTCIPVTTTITSTPSPTVTTTATLNSFCSGGSTTLSASGALTYLWMPGSLSGTGITVFPTATTTYTVTGTSANGCTGTSQITITVHPLPTTSLSSQTNISCNGGTNGSVTIAVTGGTGPYTYSWSPSGGTGLTASALAVGTYTCTTTDVNGCTTTQSVSITQPPAITATISSTPATCGNNNGTAGVLASGGSGTLIYSWAPSGGTSANASSLTTGNYTCTITDANGCTQTASVTVTNSGGPSVFLSSQTTILCTGGNNGSATVSVSGGTGPYSYSWSPSGGTGATASSLSAGTYTCTITDANSCIATQTVTLTEPAVISVSISSVPAACGNNNGSATVIASGGTGPYAYSWLPSGGTGATEASLIAGNYTCTVTDANSCTQTASVTVTNSGGPTVLLSSQTDILCNGGNNGSAVVSVSGGTGPYSYSWSPSGGTGSTASSLSAGTYTCTITDVNSCIITQTVLITEPAAISVSISSVPAACGNNNGSATVTASGGTGAFTYSWTPSGGTGATEGSLIAGNYTCTITDTNGCTQTSSVTVTNSGGPSVSLSSQTNVLCNGGNTASAGVSVSGGTSPYSYSWSPSGGTGSTANSLSAGIYTCTITDANSCIVTQIVTITEPGAVSVGISSVPATCGNNNGSATVIASGGTGPFSYLWTPSGGTGATETSLIAGNYTCTITDANGCIQTTSVMVTNSGGPSVSLSSQTSVPCNGGSTGSAVVSVSGGTSPYSYSWSPSGGTGPAAVSLPAGTYTCTITDANSCITTQTVLITEPSSVSVTTSSVPAACGNATGSATVVASGGTGTFTYSWVPSGGTSATETSLVAGSYTCTITDANGCTQTASVIVTNVGSPIANASGDTTIFLGGSAVLVGTGGINYSWSPSSGLSCATCATTNANPSSTTTYILTVTDANGCTAIDSVLITVEATCPNSGSDVFVANGFTPNDDGQNDLLFVRGQGLGEINFVIYDRWGEKVFETNDQSVGWDGTYKTKDLDAAVFVYYVTITCTSGERIIKKGNVALIR